MEDLLKLVELSNEITRRKRNKPQYMVVKNAILEKAILEILENKNDRMEI